MDVTHHRLVNGDARDLAFLPDESIHLVVTSPPYWNLKRYNEHPDQMGHIDDYECFLDELNKVWREIYSIGCWFRAGDWSVSLVMSALPEDVSVDIWCFPFMLISVLHVAGTTMAR